MTQNRTETPFTYTTENDAAHCHFGTLPSSLFQPMIPCISEETTKKDTLIKRQERLTIAANGAARPRTSLLLVSVTQQAQDLDLGLRPGMFYSPAWAPASCAAPPLAGRQAAQEQPPLPQGSPVQIPAAVHLCAVRQVEQWWGRATATQLPSHVAWGLSPNLTG